LNSAGAFCIRVAADAQRAEVKYNNAGAQVLQQEAAALLRVEDGVFEGELNL
jgi:hypothetical protein